MKCGIKLSNTDIIAYFSRTSTYILTNYDNSAGLSIVLKFSVQKLVSFAKGIWFSLH